RTSRSSWPQIEQKNRIFTSYFPSKHELLVIASTLGVTLLYFGSFSYRVGKAVGGYKRVVPREGLKAFLKRRCSLTPFGRSQG
ncbi:MAG: hypothetical protein WCP58_02130, partial [bacterium]